MGLFKRLWEDERGVGKVTIFCIVFSFFMLGIISGLYWGVVAHAKDVALQAAREGGRTAAVFHDYTLANQSAINVVRAQLPTPSGTGGAAGEPHQPFDALNPNPVTPDIVFNEDDTYVYAQVSYHVFCPIPGYPRLFKKSDSPWSNWATVMGQAVFQKEYIP
ncbi:hypothetical protein L9W92_16545 [Pelotomaculum terephthalicicum JT]|uniref:TadE/TadG family type IV pilus assembly protein n=2 Tax=Pelotomaculum TaxID=191373 RepID=UPI0009D30C8D|nr:hypothetical protein [Pelotomaculum terephthalicicum]MCG9969614.1 hypothetical protein [Pelotomaculum terephthalicicum JT]OPY58622.1 MAG: hypothetical protein A4E56_03360 [Pelotomaculum sp. PtaU1.Bin065]